MKTPQTNESTRMWSSMVRPRAYGLNGAQAFTDHIVTTFHTIEHGRRRLEEVASP